jgi:hypothetical protein
MECALGAKVQGRHGATPGRDGSLRWKQVICGQSERFEMHH